MVGGQALYERVAKSLGVDLRWSKSACHTVKEFSMAGLIGDYRRLIIRPRGLRHVLVKHSGMHEEIVSQGAELDCAHQGNRAQHSDNTDAKSDLAFAQPPGKRHGQGGVGAVSATDGTNKPAVVAQDDIMANHDASEVLPLEAKGTSPERAPVATVYGSGKHLEDAYGCLLYTSPSPRD